ncbi:MAG: BamA/TamA family outer membrane protein [Deltaproteobacteria bacterium]|nr:BamA/TamA family outer membrane protein [Deltaproteobacteria bacterium]
MSSRSAVVAVVVVLVGMTAAACAKPGFYRKVPGHTDVALTAVKIEPRAGEQLAVPYKGLFEYLGLRKKSPIRPGRTYNPYRLAEDRRRILAWAQAHGRFDAEVDEPELTWSADKQSVAVTWRVHEGAAYRIGSLEILGAPPEHAATLHAMLPFTVGDEVDLELYRPLRRALAERLQDEGYGHARGYSRTFVDRTAKTVAWFYYMDPGPQTKIGSLVVEGNKAIPAATILARTGLAAGGSYSTTEKRRAELALLDTGAFASAVVLTDADIQTGPPEFPETGGVLAPEQVSADGTLVPRRLDDALAVRVIVVEAPRRQLRAEVGVEADRTRLDTYAGARVQLRNALGPQHHVLLEGNVGYGYIFNDGRDPAQGVYGSALAQYLHPGWIARDLDLRLTGRWRDTLYPSAMLREIVVGPGVRSTVAPGVFVDLDAFYRIGRQLDQPMLDLAGADPDLRLATTDDSQGALLVASAIADRRDDRVEPTAGWLLAARGAFSPGGPLGDHRWLALGVEGRAFRRLSREPNGPLSAGVRVASSWVLLPGDAGVPLGPRLFGGGAYGMRGFGRDRLSPVVASVAGGDAVVGGRSLVEASAELRFLPFRKQVGAAAFVDAGAAGAGTNAFADGISVAAGIGGRIRLWYVPIAIDLAYRFVDGSQFSTAGGFDRLGAFFRVGEAF